MTEFTPIETDLQQHRAAQYLSSFAINFLEKKDDDSHINLAWNPVEKSLSSRPTDSGHSLKLKFEDLSLEWVGKSSFVLDLVGRSHGEIVTWLHHCAIRAGLEEYDFYLHYKLDSGKLNHDMIYYPQDEVRTAEVISYRDSALAACEAVREYFDLDTEIRVWPHHFDTGGYAVKGDLGIGFGLAFPDSMVDDYYLYVSAYEDGKGVSTEGLAAPSIGQWYNDGFKGAVLPVSGLKEEEYRSFMTEAVDILKMP